MGRRAYDAHITTDHDLLVRIDERLGTHMLAHSQFLQQYATDRATTESRLKRLEDERSERAGAERANARFIALVVGSASVSTAVVVKIAEKLIS